MIYEPIKRTRWDPEPPMRSALYLMDELRKALGTGHFAPGVRLAEHLATLIRVSAIAEERDYLLNPAPFPIVKPPDEAQQ